jgi:hypothetical protein
VNHGGKSSIVLILNRFQHLERERHEFRISRIFCIRFNILRIGNGHGIRLRLFPIVQKIEGSCADGNPEDQT